MEKIKSCLRVGFGFTSKRHFLLISDKNCYISHGCVGQMKSVTYDLNGPYQAKPGKAIKFDQIRGRCYKHFWTPSLGLLNPKKVKN